MRFLRWLAATLDARDMLFAVGWALFTAGLWQMHPASALIGGGAVLLYTTLKG